MDRRKGRSVSDANKLWTCKNAFINNGRVPQKRPGLTHVATLESGTIGLVPHNGYLNTFYVYDGATNITHANTLFKANAVGQVGFGPLYRVHDWEVFNGYIYVSVQSDNSGGEQFHCYIDGFVPNLVPQATSPNSSKSLQRAASKMFAADGDTVAYSATSDPEDWVTASDAGYLPTGIQAQGSEDSVGLGRYKDLLVVFAEDNIQTWNVNADPALMSLSEIVPNMGTIYPHSIGNVAGDVYFLASMDVGYRSISMLELTQNLANVDVGGPIDSFIQSQTEPTNEPFAIWYQNGGQYWNFRDNKADVYTFSRVSKISAWSYYEFPFSIDAACELSGILYLRSGDDVYKVDKDAYEDDDGVGGTTAIAVDVEMNFQSMKKPGQEKMFLAADVVCQGETSVTFRYDPDNTALATESVSTSNDSRREGVIPLDIMATEIAPRFQHSANEAWRLDLVNLYYEVLGV